MNFNFLNKRGQSSITDAMYFLIIVAGLSSFMFVVANSYGQNISQQMSSQYQIEYANSALKTILYSSVPRVPNETLSEAQEIDYLLAAIKEDYANDRIIETETLKLVLDSVQKTMAPVKTAFDYMFYIYIPERNYVSSAGSSDDGANSDSTREQESAVVLLILKKTPIELGPETPGRPDLDARILSGRDTGGVAEYYFCYPPDFSAITNRLFPRLTNLSKPIESRVYLSVFERVAREFSTLGGVSAPTTFDARSNMVLWTPTNFPRGFDAIEDFGALGCVTAEDVLGDLLVTP